MKRAKRAETPKRMIEAPRRPILAREVVVLAAVLLVGVWLRGQALVHSAVEHFDEGVYASNLFFGPPNYAWPMQHLYAPPLLPTLIEAGMIAGLPMNLAALLPSFVAGCATILVLWWVGRSWFGAGVGIAAATLCALSDLHILYSATALTDVLLGLLVLIAVHCLAQSLRLATPAALGPGRGQRVENHRPELVWAVCAGLVTGAAWWTKYSGWLPLAIGAAAVAMLVLLLRPGGKRLVRWTTCLGVMACVAVIVWGPYVASLQDRGGYTSVAANHAKYFVGLVGWASSLVRHVASQSAIEGVPGVLGLPAALFAWQLAAPPATSRGSFFAGDWRRLIVAGATVGLLAFGAWWGSSFVVLSALAPLGCMAAVIAAHSSAAIDEVRLQRAIPAALVAVWWGGLFVMTPCYTPYPRLLLPWLMASWLGTSLWLTEVALPRVAGDKAEGLRAAPPIARGWFVASVFIAGAATLTAALLRPEATIPDPAPDRQQIVQIARQMRADAARAVASAGDGAEARRAICVFAEPALVFQLRVAGEYAVLVVENVPPEKVIVHDQPVPTLLAVGPHARADRRFQEQWARQHGQWQLVAEYPYQPSRVVWFDLFDPVRGEEAGTRRATGFALYRMVGR